jgi:hypothetical protein
MRGDFHGTEDFVAIHARERRTAALELMLLYLRLFDSILAAEQP